MGIIQRTAVRRSLSLALLIGIVVAIAASLPPGPAGSVGQACGTAISFGVTIKCSIDGPGDTDVYSFEAQAGDVVLVGMGVAGPGLDPEVRVMFGATLICSAATFSSSGGALAEASTCQLVSAGTYTIVAGDLGGNEGGAYGLHLQRLNNPGNAPVLPFDQTVNDSIDSPGDADSYTFSALAGKVVLVRMGVSVAGLDPRVRVFDPDGALVVDPGTGSCSAAAFSSSGGALAEISACTMPSEGMYTVFASDLGGNESGDYGLTLQCLTPPCGDGSPPTPPPTPTPTGTPLPTSTLMPTPIPTSSIPTPTPAPKDPIADTDGDTIPNNADVDDDNDGCTDEQEMGSDEQLGGQRDPHNFWDFYDPTQDRAVSTLDIFAVLQRFGSVGDPEIDPKSDPPPPPAYHTRFDRGPSVGPSVWNLGPADGAISVTDFFSLLVQFGHSCS